MVMGHLSDHLVREDDREEEGPHEGGRHHENENVRGRGDHDRGCGRAHDRCRGRDCAHGHGRGHDCVRDHDHGNESESGNESGSESVCKGRIRGHASVVEGVRSAELQQANTPNSPVSVVFEEWAERQLELQELVAGVVDD